jgi:cyclopropane fatty-acyl-phospholipid synthase-like methyltransferase
MIFLKNILKAKEFDSQNYWEKRYLKGGDSGDGSYGKLAEFKAKIINRFVKINEIKTIIEWGCGDGNQLTYMNYPVYVGFDVSQAVIANCNKKFKKEENKTFLHIDEYTNQSATLTISLDVIFHLIEDHIFNDYMNRLFNSSQKFVIIYSSNTSEQFETVPKHFRQRKFTKWIKKYKSEFLQIDKIKNEYPYDINSGKGSVSDFYFFQKSK